eukprot:CAMPEP_0170312478 /NCGR_PEP_ID=MMETSP0116_2-20130129/56774_1 /TAXON_ID=400756 /ORGANISM="Durinskia baltica, Strain CSIRO CS-38" /LENGTH=150 /DNA_ID=CAMNT_0010564851 /DNA_START=16 /DNA_END=465 /DNA_ORIENTATION=+
MAKAAPFKPLCCSGHCGAPLRTCTTAQAKSHPSGARSAPEECRNKAGAPSFRGRTARPASVSTLEFKNDRKRAPPDPTPTHGAICSASLLRPPPGPAGVRLVWQAMSSAFVAFEAVADQCVAEACRPRDARPTVSGHRLHSPMATSAGAR